MKYILDTHSFLWSIFDTSKLPANIREVLSNTDNDIYVSSITFWEISLKYSIGKLSLENIQPEKLPKTARKSGFEILPIDEIITSSFYKLPKYGHTDPFDRLLIWQAINLNYTVISKDSAFDNYVKNGLKVLWD